MFAASGRHTLRLSTFSPVVESRRDAIQRRTAASDLQERDCRTDKTSRPTNSYQQPTLRTTRTLRVRDRLYVPGTTNAPRASSRATSAEVAVLVPAALATGGGDGGGGGSGGGGGGGGGGDGGGGWSGTRGSRDSHGADAWFDFNQRPGR